MRFGALKNFLDLGQFHMVDTLLPTATGEAAVRDPQSEPSDLIRSVSRALRVLEAVGQSPRGLTVKQIARRCDFTVATTYHLVRTLAYEGYVIRRENGTYVVGLVIADRYRDLLMTFRGPTAVLDRLRRAAVETGYTHFLGRFIGGRVAVTACVEGIRTPGIDEPVPTFNDAAHATALGKALLATLNSEQRLGFLKEYGMRSFTPATLNSPETLDADLVAGERRGMQIEIGQYQQGMACAAVPVLNDRDSERRVVLACALPPAELMSSAKLVRTRLVATAHQLANILRD
jgi:DNA-binding IclR family transcriptional regulator